VNNECVNTVDAQLVEAVIEILSICSDNKTDKGARLNEDEDDCSGLQ
jgi:hypothetical protein